MPWNTRMCCVRLLFAENSTNRARRAQRCHGRSSDTWLWQRMGDKLLGAIAELRYGHVTDSPTNYGGALID